MSTTSSLVTALRTTLALCGRFSASFENQDVISAALAQSNSISTTPSPSPSPLPLLSAAAKSLRAQVTKLSLLAITPPLTPSALVDVLSTINESILGSLAMAAQLVTAEQFTKKFHRETVLLAKAALRDLGGLVGIVQDICKSRGGDRAPDTDKDKEAVTEATGRVWDSCDALVRVADDGVGTFVAREAEQFLALVKDAVKELEEWEPGEDEDGFQELIESDEEENEAEADEHVDGEQHAALNKCKEEVLAVLRRIPMTLHVIIKNRLQKGLPVEFEKQHVEKLNTVLEQYKRISDTVDEAAGTLYEGDMKQSLRHVQDAKQMTVDVAESLLHPWTFAGNQGQLNSAANGPSKEDRYVQKALEWIKAAGSDRIESQATEATPRDVG